ncbi:MAG: M43 family zinc metalloprotease [Ferruginibacter sp.]
MKLFVSLLFFYCIIITANAQRVCAVAEYSKKQLQSNPTLAAAYQAVEDHIYNTLHAPSASRDTAANELIMIPVVVHILYKSSDQNISDAQVKSQIDVLNKDYRRLNADTVNTPAVFKTFAGDVHIKFCLAQVDPDSRRTNGIVRRHTNSDYFEADDAMKYSAQGGDNAWDSKKYLNIWICNLGSRLLGYAAPPGGPAERDGVTINFDAFGTVGNLRPVFNKGRTATHEIAHWLGVKHIWGDDNCGDDGVDDTPKQQYYNYYCPAFPHVSPCSPNGNGDMFMNFMDFTDDACMNEFTNGQKRRMRALFATGGPRNSFLSASACDSSQAQGGPIGDDGSADKGTDVKPVDPVKVYPNPTADMISITCKTAETIVGKTLNVYNMMGTLVLTQQLKTAENKISLRQLPQGAYIIRIDTDKKTAVTIVRL